MSKYLDMDGLSYLWSQIKSKLGTKVDKIEGKGLSTNDYTTTEKTKLSGIATGANNYTHPLSGVQPGTYTKVTVDDNGHITEASSPTTLNEYGIEMPDIPTVPEAIKNPNALSLVLNGATINYDGSSEQTVNINENSLGITSITDTEIDTILVQ